MDRILQATEATIVVDYGTDPVPDEATVRVLRADGTEMVESTAATGGDDGEFSYTLSPEDTVDLDFITAEWTTSLGTVRTHAEIVGGFIFALSELAALRDVQQLPEPERTDEKLAAIRTTAEQAFEKAASERLKYRVAYVPRFAYQRRLRADDDFLALGSQPVRALRSATAGADTLDLSGVELEDDGAVGLWPNRNVSVFYEYGYDRPDEDIKRAVLTLAKNWLIEGPIDDRSTSVATETGGTILLATPGVRGSVFGIPAVDAALPRERTVVRSVKLDDGYPAANVSRLDFYTT